MRKGQFECYFFRKFTMNSNICNDCENCAKVITIKNSSVEKMET